MGRGSSKAGANAGKVTQKATNARDIENMNEAQLDREIERAQNAIDRAESRMDRNDITNSAEARAMQEAFPLGVGGDGWSEERRRAREQGLERDVTRAREYSEAYSEREAAQTRLGALERARDQVSGTGKTMSQLRSEAVNRAVEETPKTLNWTTTQRGGWSNGGYAPRIISSGNFEIHGTDGLYTIFRDGKRLGQTNKLATAKAYVERINRGGK